MYLYRVLALGCIALFTIWTEQSVYTAVQVFVISESIKNQGVWCTKYGRLQMPTVVHIGRSIVYCLIRSPTVEPCLDRTVAQCYFWLITFASIFHFRTAWRQRVKRSKNDGDEQEDAPWQIVTWSSMDKTYTVLVALVSGWKVRPFGWRWIYVQMQWCKFAMYVLLIQWWWCCSKQWTEGKIYCTNNLLSESLQEGTVS